MLLAAVLLVDNFLFAACLSAVRSIKKVSKNIKLHGAIQPVRSKLQRNHQLDEQTRNDLPWNIACSFVIVPPLHCGKLIYNPMLPAAESFPTPSLPATCSLLLLR
jgi:hypothetical protein